MTWDSEFTNGQSMDGFPSTMRNNIRQSMYKWDDVNTGMDFDVHEAYSGEDAWVRSVSFDDLGWGSGPAITYNSSSGGKIYFSTISFNSDWLWDNASCEVDFDDEAGDVRVVATHEAGHLISLHHDNNFRDAVMWPDGECKLYLTYDDKRESGTSTAKTRHNKRTSFAN